MLVTLVLVALVVSSPRPTRCVLPQPSRGSAACSGFASLAAELVALTPDDAPVRARLISLTDASRFAPALPPDVSSRQFAFIAALCSRAVLLPLQLPRCRTARFGFNFLAAVRSTLNAVLSLSRQFSSVYVLLQL